MNNLKDIGLFFILGIWIGMIIFMLVFSLPKNRYDVNGDNEVNVLDAVTILNYIKGE